MTQFLKNLKAWPAKLVFWRKPAAVEDAPAEADTTPAEVTDEAAAVSDQPAAKPGWLARINGWFVFRRKQSGDSESAEAAAPESDAEASVDQQAPPPATDETESPAPKLSLAARLKRMFRFRRKPVEADTDAAADDKTQVIEQASATSDAPAAEGDGDAPPLSRLKRIIARLRSKWGWIPASSLAVIGMAAWVIVSMMHAASDKARLQAELAAAKKLLNQKAVASAAPVAAAPVAAPAKPEPKIDPAFNIVGHIPAAQSEEVSGINAADCVITDKNSVATNLKSCITSFNQAVASPPNKLGKP